LETKAGMILGAEETSWGWLNVEKLSFMTQFSLKMTKIRTTLADLSWDSHFLQNQGPVGTVTMP
jgi:hypothetical protein